MKKSIRILLVDDHELTRHELRYTLDSEEDIEVVSDCASAEEAFAQMAGLSPDIVLMDIQMPGMDGIYATRYLKGNGQDYDVDIVLLAEDANYLVEALEAGAAGYLLKDTKGAELAEAIRQVYQIEHLPEEGDGFVEGAVELIIPAPIDAARLLRFIDQVEGTLHASILQTAGSWDWGVVITILPKPTLLANILDKLGGMPDVEKVAGELPARDGFSSFPRKLRALPRSRISPKERILITLK